MPQPIKREKRAGTTRPRKEAPTSGDGGDDELPLARVFGTKRPRKEAPTGGDGGVDCITLDTQAEYSHKTPDQLQIEQSHAEAKGEADPKETEETRKQKEKGRGTQSFSVVTDPVRPEYYWCQGKLQQKMAVVEKMVEVLVVAPFEDTEDVFSPYEETFSFHMKPGHNIANLVKAFAHKVQLVCPGYIPAFERMLMDRIPQLDCIGMEVLGAAFCITQKTDGGERPVDYIYNYMDTMRTLVQGSDDERLRFRLVFKPARTKRPRQEAPTSGDGAHHELPLCRVGGNWRAPLDCITLSEPLLALALLRNIKKYEMRQQRFAEGAYLIHVGGGRTPLRKDYKDLLEQEWPSHPPYGSHPFSAIYGLIYLETPEATENLHDPWADLGTWGMRGAWGIEFETPVLQVKGNRGVWGLRDETAIAEVRKALHGATLRTFPAALKDETVQGSPKAQEEYSGGGLSPSRSRARWSFLT